MKSNSSVRPEKYFKSQELIFIVDMPTVIETEITQENEKEPILTKSYTYDYYELPITDRDNLTEYIELNYDVLLEFAKAKQIEKDRYSPSENEKLWDAITYILTSDIPIVE